MYINAVTSSMGAWRTLKSQHRRIFNELEEALGTLGLRKPFSTNWKRPWAPSDCASPNTPVKPLSDACIKTFMSPWKALDGT